MKTKAELEREVRSLKRRIAQYKKQLIEMTARAARFAMPYRPNKYNR